jgi:hypothetical protein
MNVHRSAQQHERPAWPQLRPASCQPCQLVGRRFHTYGGQTTGTLVSPCNVRKSLTTSTADGHVLPLPAVRSVDLSETKSSRGRSLEALGCLPPGLITCLAPRDLLTGTVSRLLVFWLANRLAISFSLLAISFSWKVQWRVSCTDPSQLCFPPLLLPPLDFRFLPSGLTVRLRGWVGLHMMAGRCVRPQERGPRHVGGAQEREQ